MPLMTLINHSISHSASSYTDLRAGGRELLLCRSLQCPSLTAISQAAANSRVLEKQQKKALVQTQPQKTVWLQQDHLESGLECSTTCFCVLGWSSFSTEKIAFPEAKATLRSSLKQTIHFSNSHFKSSTSCSRISASDVAVIYIPVDSGKNQN